MNHDLVHFDAFSTKCVEIDALKIYINDINVYLAECYVLYSQIHLNHMIQIENLFNLSRSSSSRKFSIESIAVAMKKNLTNVSGIRSILSNYLSLDDIIMVKTNPNNDVMSYLKDFHYLKRDWSGDKRSECQLKIINDAIKEALELVEDKENALFLGAGTARIAFDLTDSHEKVYVTDKSFSMAWHFNELKLENEIDFFEINTKNVRRINDQVKPIRVSLYNVASKYEILGRIPKINYFISDALNLPLQDKSMSIVYSIYFTDIIALKLLLPEIVRVLKIGGVFVHFGPLDYFFNDLKEAMTCEEVISFFEENGFIVIVNKFVDSEHLYSENSLSNKIYSNWMFVARYQFNMREGNLISLNSVVEVNRLVKYVTYGQISKNDEKLHHCMLMPDGEEFEGAGVAIDIMRLVNGSRSVGDIIEALSEIYGKLSIDQIQGLLSLVQKLVDKKVIAVSLCS